MKLLSISDGKGFFLSEAGSPAPLDQISKDDLLRLVDQTLTADVELDAYDATQLQNQAHQIIYENIWSRLTELASRKKEFVDESKRLYLTEFERYKSDSPSQPKSPAQDAHSAPAQQATDRPAAS